MSEKLHLIADPNGIEVYFQPPEDLKMTYPCFVYELEGVFRRSADDGAYFLFDRYQVTFIHHDPDSPVTRMLFGIPYSSFSRRYATSDLTHDVFVIYH